MAHSDPHKHWTNDEVTAVRAWLARLDDHLFEHQYTREDARRLASKKLGFAVTRYLMRLAVFGINVQLEWQGGSRPLSRETMYSAKEWGRLTDWLGARPELYERTPRFIALQMRRAGFRGVSIHAARECQGFTRPRKHEHQQQQSAGA